MKQLKILGISLVIISILSGCSSTNNDSDINIDETQIASESFSTDESLNSNNKKDEEQKTDTDELALLEDMLNKKKQESEKNLQESEEIEEIQEPLDITSGKVIDTEELDLSMYNNANFVDNNNNNSEIDYLAMLYETYNCINDIQSVCIPALLGTNIDNKYSDLDMSENYYKTKLNQDLDTLDYKNSLIQSYSATDTDLLKVWNSYYNKMKSIDTELRELNIESSIKGDIKIDIESINTVTANLSEALKIRTENYSNQLQLNSQESINEEQNSVEETIQEEIITEENNKLD